MSSAFLLLCYSFYHITCSYLLRTKNKLRDYQDYINRFGLCIRLDLIHKLHLFNKIMENAEYESQKITQLKVSNKKMKILIENYL